MIYTVSRSVNTKLFTQEMLAEFYRFQTLYRNETCSRISCYLEIDGRRIANILRQRDAFEEHVRKPLQIHCRFHEYTILVVVVKHSTKTFTKDLKSATNVTENLASDNLSQKGLLIETIDTFNYTLICLPPLMADNEYDDSSARSSSTFFLHSRSPLTSI